MFDWQACAVSHTLAIALDANLKQLLGSGPSASMFTHSTPSVCGSTMRTLDK